jgi:hypothetical protein
MPWPARITLTLLLPFYHILLASRMANAAQPPSKSEDSQAQQDTAPKPQEETPAVGAGTTPAPEPPNLSKLTLSQILHIPKVCELYDQNDRLQARIETLLDKNKALEEKVAQLEQELRVALVSVPAPQPMSRYLCLLFPSAY